MDNSKRILLQHHQNDIVKDLDVKYIMDYLLSKQALSTDDYDYIIDTLKSRAERTRYLLNVLIQKGSNKAYEVFVDSLSKDHRWLWEKFTVQTMNESQLNESFEDILSRGDVPRLPEHYVSRRTQEENLKSRLGALARHKILALHGMSGSGKSSLVIGVLRTSPTLVTEQFGGVVFWLNMGDVKTDDDIIMLQNRLHRKTTSIFHRESSYMNSSVSISSISSNLDNNSLSSSDWTGQDLKDLLKDQFAEPPLKESLLVLDEVNKRRCVEAFDIGCKILVTTRDTSVVTNFQPQIINIQNNFEVSESLELFASCLDVDVGRLPKQAKVLHNICKGGPFHIALIGAQLAENRERLIHDTHHWNYYIDKLAKRGFIHSLFRSKNSENFNPTKAIEMCLETLPSDILPLFKKLAVLPDNAKVSAKVLSVLWGKDVNEVERIMKQLRSKSLISEQYVQEQRNYIYEVYDLIMDYLRLCFNKDETKRLHVDFLKNYKYDLNNVSMNLDDDGYIAFYIGYHICRTGNLNNEWCLFNKLYMNLRFLGNKVRLTGPADVIMDFQIYEDKICENDIDRELLVNIKDFLSTHGNDLYKYPSTDIVQSILQHIPSGILHCKAHAIAQTNSNQNQLYFDFLHEHNVQEIKHTTIDVKEIVSTVCFLGDHVIVGTANTIKIFHVYTNKLKKELSNSAGRISWMATCPSNPLRLAALSVHGLLQIWYIDDFEHKRYEDTIEEESESTDYKDELYESHIKISPKLGQLLNCRWANQKEMLVTHTSQTIILYRPDGSVIKVLDNFDRNWEILCCTLSNDDRYVITGSVINSINYIDIIHLQTKERVMTFDKVKPIYNILNVPGNNDRILVMNDSDIVMHEWKLNGSPNKHHTCASKSIIASKEVKDNLTFISAVVNRSGTLLFVSTDDSRIICIDLETNAYVFDLDNRRGNVVSMAVSEISYDDFVLGPDVLLSGTGTVENSVKVWYLDTSYVAQATQKHRKVRLTTKFAASFLNTALSPQTPSACATPPPDQSAVSTPRRNQSFAGQQDTDKRLAKKTLSLDRHSLKPLNLKGICNGNDDLGLQPLLAVVDDKNNIQIMRGRKVLTEITTRTNDIITVVKISPCNQYIIFGLKSGLVKKYIVRTKECNEIMDVNSPVQYLNFVNAYLLIVFGANKRLMAYKLPYEGDWKLDMLQAGNMQMGSQEILNDIQGLKKKNLSNNNQCDTVSNAGSEASISSKERQFPPAEGKGRLCKDSCLVQCFWVDGIGMLTVENNATIKLWDQDLKLSTVLSARQSDALVNCAAFQNNTLAICDDYGHLQTFDLRENTDEVIYLRTIQEYKLNNKIVSCDLTKDGHILAMGLDSGVIVLWNVPGKRQLFLLQHHKSRVQSCVFSPMPEKLYRSGSAVAGAGAGAGQSPCGDADDGRAPLVLVTMATEIVWWNVSHVLRTRPNRGMLRPGGRNVLTPIGSPMDSRTELTAPLENLHINSNCFFFGNNALSAYGSWEMLWRHKTGKDDFKKKEILACIKLSGMNAKKLCYDERFSCFVTVDNPGHVHIMNMIKPHRES